MADQDQLNHFQLHLNCKRHGNLNFENNKPRIPSPVDAASTEMDTTCLISNDAPENILEDTIQGSTKEGRVRDVDSIEQAQLKLE